MDRIISFILALLLALSALAYRAVQGNGFSTSNPWRQGWQTRQGGSSSQPQPSPAPPPEPAPEPAPVPDPAPAPPPTIVFQFGGAPFLTYGEETRDIAYQGSMFNEIYNYGAELSPEEIGRLKLSLRIKTVESGAFLDYLAAHTRGADPYIEPRAVTINGVDEPYRCLYVRLQYPDEYFEDRSYSAIFDQDLDLLRLNCDAALLEHGIETLIFSMHNNGELKVLSIIRQENGSFVFD